MPRKHFLSDQKPRGRPDPDAFDVASYLLTFQKPEDQARTIIESGWTGDTSIESIQSAAADPHGGYHQRVLAGLICQPEKKPCIRTKKRLGLKAARVLKKRALPRPEHFAIALARIANPDHFDEVDPAALTAAVKLVGGLRDGKRAGLVRDTRTRSSNPRTSTGPRQ